MRVELSAPSWLAALGLSLVWGCSAPTLGTPKLAREAPAAPVTGAPAASSASPPSPGLALGPEERLTLELNQRAVQVSLRPPEGWQRAQGRGATWLPPEQPDPDQQEVHLSLSAECMGQCGAASTARNLAAFRAKLAQAQVTYTDDSLSATSRREIARSTTTPLGWALLQREFFDAGDVERGRGRWHERFRVVHVSHRKQDDFFLLCEGIGLLTREQAFADAMFSACASAVIAGVSKTTDQ